MMSQRQDDLKEKLKYYQITCYQVFLKEMPFKSSHMWIISFFSKCSISHVKGPTTFRRAWCHWRALEASNVSKAWLTSPLLRTNLQYLPTSWDLKRGRPLDIGVLYTGQPWVCDENEAGTHSTVELWAAAKLPTGVLLEKIVGTKAHFCCEILWSHQVGCCNSTAIVEIFVLRFVVQVSFCASFFDERFV